MGDCDDMVTLFACLAMAVGKRAGFRTVKADGERPNEYSHVFALVQWPGSRGWVPADPTEQLPLGASPERGRRIYAATNWEIKENGGLVPEREEGTSMAHTLKSCR